MKIKEKMIMARAQGTKVHRSFQKIVRIMNLSGYTFKKEPHINYSHFIFEIMIGL